MTSPERPAAETRRVFKFDDDEIVDTLVFEAGDVKTKDRDGMDWYLSTVLAPGTCWTEVKEGDT